MEKLINEVGLTVSPNTMSKWFHGTARPRPDNIRKIAQALSVDEVWLAMGRKPADQAAATAPGAESARGAVLVLAGLIEMHGGRISFPGADSAPLDLQVNLAGEQFGALVVPVVERDGKCSVMVNEPVGDARILAVVTGDPTETGCSSCVKIIDLTDVDRESFGGFSVIQLERRKDGKFKNAGQTRLLSPVHNLDEIAEFARGINHLL